MECKGLDLEEVTSSDVLTPSKYRDDFVEQYGVLPAGPVRRAGRGNASVLNYMHDRPWADGREDAMPTRVYLLDNGTLAIDQLFFTWNHGWGKEIRFPVYAILI